MHVRQIRIRNIRSLKEVNWEVSASKTAGWHVIVGDNGSGKSSFLRSIALAMIGPKDAASLRLAWEDWLRKDQSVGFIELGIDWDRTHDKFAMRGPTPRTPPLHLGVSFTRRKRRLRPVDLKATRASVEPRRHVWGVGKGWFCAAYGPYRRLTGGDPTYDRLFYKFPKLARYISIFEERVALTECIEWLQSLKFEQLESTGRPRPEEGALGPTLLPAIFGFVNQPGFLPFQAHLQEITSKEVYFVDGSQNQVRIEDLSDGYRSILSMTFELIRQLATTFGPARVFDPNDPTKVIAPGVVLIDEIDVHLHPTWQRKVGLFFRQHFPNIQFIVSTHSPLICQAADIGTVYLLPRPGEDHGGGMVRGSRLERLLYGNVLDAYGTEVFGPDISRSEEGKAKQNRLAYLNVKETRQGLTDQERKEQERLRGALPSTAHILVQPNDSNQ